MLVALCLIAWVLLLALIKTYREGDPYPWRSAFLAASVMWGVLVVVATEGLSAFHLITFGWIAGFWAVVVALLAAACVIARQRIRQAVKVTIPDLRPFAIPLAGIALILGVTAFINFFATPNNVDSLIYHLPRVEHWIQDRSVAHYTTYVEFQLYHGPWAEFAVMQLQLLSGWDHLSSFVQWFAMLGCSLGSSLIAARLGASTRIQVLTALLAASIPIGILEAQTQQNDYAVAFWLVCVVYYTLKAAQSEVDWYTTLLFGGSVGLILLTKGSGYGHAVAFSIWFAVSGFRKLGLRFLFYGAAIVAMVVAINAPHMARNLAIFNSPFGLTERYINEIYGPVPLLSNVIRNIAINIYAPTVSVRSAMTDALNSIFAALGIAVSDPRITFQNFRFLLLRSRYIYFEDRAGNPLHILLLGIAIAAAVFRRDLRSQRGLMAYLAAIVGMFLVFCIVYKWYPFITRLHLPMLVVAAPFIAVVISHVLAKVWVDRLAILVVVLSLPFLFVNASHPIIILPNPVQRVIFGTPFERASIFSDPDTQYFVNASAGTQQSYVAAAAQIRSSRCMQIGLILGPGADEYPLWAMLSAGPGRTRIEHIGASVPPYKPLGPPDDLAFVPCAVLAIDQPLDFPTIVRGGTTYVRANDLGRISIFLPQ